jgi:hypothetical protein
VAQNPGKTPERAIVNCSPVRLARIWNGGGDVFSSEALTK